MQTYNLETLKLSLVNLLQATLLRPLMSADTDHGVMKWYHVYTL